MTEKLQTAIVPVLSQLHPRRRWQAAAGGGAIEQIHPAAQLQATAFAVHNQ
jgi:hypothetical protein